MTNSSEKLVHMSADELVCVKDVHFVEMGGTRLAKETSTQDIENILMSAT